MNTFSKPIQNTEETTLMPSSELLGISVAETESSPKRQPLGILRGNAGTYPLYQHQILIGRHPTCDIRLNDMAVSNRHCFIIFDNNRVHLRDVSTNGTRVNRILIGKGKTVTLYNSDHIEIIPSTSTDKTKNLFLVFYDLTKPRLSLFPAYENMLQLGSYTILDKIIGRGASGIIKTAVDNETGQMVAIKIILLTDREKSTAQSHHLNQEIAILKTIDHFNLIQVFNIHTVDGAVCVFMELVDGGDFFSYIERNVCLSESESRFHAYQLMRGLMYLHARNICHRDLKPENILVEMSVPYPRLVITDFGLAKMNLGRTILKTQCGTIGFLAPEVACGKSGYTTAVDCWSLGVITFNMISGYMPFPENSQITFSNAAETIKLPLQFDPLQWRNISPEAINVISELMETDPVKRLSIQKALMHPWILEYEDCLKKMYAHIKSTTGHD